jgi:hypothetical protein
MYQLMETLSPLKESLLVHLKLGPCVSTFRRTNFPKIVKDFRENRCPFKTIHPTFHFLMAILTYSLDRPPSMEMFMQKEDKNGFRLSEKWVLHLLHRRSSPWTPRDYFAETMFCLCNGRSEIRDYLSEKLPDCFRPDTEEITWYKIINSVFAIIQDQTLYDLQNTEMIRLDEGLERIFNHAVVSRGDLEQLLKGTTTRRSKTCFFSERLHGTSCKCTYRVPPGAYYITDPCTTLKNATVLSPLEAPLRTYSWVEEKNSTMFLALLENKERRDNAKPFKQNAKYWLTRE